VFLAGIAVGVVSAREVTRYMQQMSVYQPERFQAVAELHIARELWLDKSQRAQLHEILTDSRNQLRDVRQQFQPQMGLVISNADAKISAMLKPEQQATFVKLTKSNMLLDRPVRPPPPVH
jgi:hypothetical protein